MALRRYPPEAFGPPEYHRKVENLIQDTDLNITSTEIDSNEHLPADAIPINIDLGGQNFSAIYLGEDKKPFIREGVDVIIFHEGHWARRMDIPQEYLPAHLRVGPTGKPPTELFTFYIKKEELNRLEETFKAK
jgi:hypothetical protein